MKDKATFQNKVKVLNKLFDSGCDTEKKLQQLDMEAILKILELKDVILEIADDLYNDCKISEYGSYHDEIWEQKYIYKTYKRTK